MTTVGTLGSSWRATVTPWGRIDPWGGDEPLDWWVAADDRWHSPGEEAAVRQVSLSGTPVVETRLRVPQGDVIHRAFAVADHGGCTVVEVTNDSPLPVAVAFSHRRLLTTRPASDVPVQGIDLPADAVLFPVGHHAVLRVALAHDGRVTGALGETPAPTLVERGWLAQMERAGRLVLPTADDSERLVRERCELALAGLDDPEDDPIGYLLGAGELVRLGAPAAELVPDVVTVVERVARQANTWDLDRALAAVGGLLSAAGERRGVADVVDLRRRKGSRTSAALAMPEGVRAIAWVEDRFARPAADFSTVALMPIGFRGDLLGANFETYRLPAGADHRVSFAVRWHGDRPAVLWEVEGPAGLQLTHGDWSTTEPVGEALWPAPGET